MEICSRFTGMERKDGAFLLHTDNANVKVSAPALTTSWPRNPTS